MKHLTIIFSVIISLASTFVANAQDYPTVQKYGNKYRFEKNGRSVSKDYDIAYDFYNNNLAIVGNKNLIGKYKYGYINANGTEVIPLEYDDAKQFSEGLAAVKKNDKFGFINESGRLVIPFQFGDVEWGFIAGKSWVRFANKRYWCLIDKYQTIVKETDGLWKKQFDYQTGAIELEYYPFKSSTLKLKSYDKNGEEYESFLEAQVGMSMPKGEMKVYTATTSEQEYKIEINSKSTIPPTKVEIEIIDNTIYVYDPRISCLRNSVRALRGLLNARQGVNNSTTTIDVTNNISINSNFITIRRNLPFKEGYNFFFIKITNSNGVKGELVGVMNCSRGVPLPLKPILNLLSATSSNSPNYHFKVGVKSSAKVKSVSFSVNGVSTRGIEVVPDNTYDFDFERDVVLQSGNDTLTLSVTNVNGNTTTQDWIIRYIGQGSGSEPTLSWDSPLSVNSRTYYLKVGVHSQSKVEEVNVYHNGSLYRGIKVNPTSNSDMDIERTIVLVDGTNNIRVEVRNTAGTKSIERSIIYKGDSPLALRKIALVIGSNNYQHIDNLKKAINDADSISQKLQKLGFTVIKKTDVDKRTLDDAIRNFGQQARAYDAAVFYYAGHGLQMGGINYLVPTDADIKDSIDIKYNCIQADEILDRMTGCNMKIMILDACRNNPFRGPSRGLTSMSAPSGTYIAFSTNIGNVAIDGTGNNSPFAEAFLKCLDYTGEPIESFFKGVMREVKQATGNRQIPWTQSSFDGDFYFNQQ